tara:strand:- start:139 stop:291 length:153 start_codon:yes stop_codon:yes gene_type:complete
MTYYPDRIEMNGLVLRLTLAWERYSLYDIDDDRFIQLVELAMRKAGIIDD